jgi:magnesium transporter
MRETPGGVPVASLPAFGLRNKARDDRPVNRGKVPLSAYVVDCAVYVDGVRLPGRWTHTAAIEEVRSRGAGFVWIGLHEPDEDQINGIAETFGLHELAVEDAVSAHQRPKLERYQNTLFLVLKTVRYVAHQCPTTANEIVETGEIMVFMGPDFVVTVRHGRHASLTDLRRRLEDDPEQLALGPAAVLHAVSDHVVDAYLEVTDAIEADIDFLEADVFAPHTPVDAEPIYLMKREIMELRRAVMPLATPLRRLAEGYPPMIAERVRSYFRDVDDHLTGVTERVTGYDELLTSLIDAALAKITLRQNTDMRRITAWVAIISVPTMLAGIYGQNFDMLPGAHSKAGFWVMSGLMVLACTLLYLSFKKRKWL